MTTSKRLAGLLLLTTAMVFPTMAMAQDEGVAVDASEDASTAPADEEVYDQPDVSIPGGEIIVTGRRNRDVIRSSTQVVNVLTTEEIARTGEGDIAGALSRVTGLSVVGNGLVYVRGLGDRYSLALLNGLPLPSPEPLSRVVPLDIFPTNIVASSLVQKTYSANFPGEFGGGVINLTTNVVPEESFLKIGGGISGDTETTFSNGLSYFGSHWDWFGFDSGNRDTPSNLQAFYDSGARLEDTPISVQEGIAAQIFPTNLVTLQKIGELPVNFSADVTGGTSFDVADGRIGVIATASIKNEWRNRVVHRQQATPDLSTVIEDFETFVTDNRVLVNGLVGIGGEFGEHKVRWTNLFIRDTLKQASLAEGTNIQLGETGFDFLDQNTAWYERQLIDSQLVGEFQFGDLGVDVRGGYAQTDRESPYNATISYTRTNLTGSPLGEYYVAYHNRLSDTRPQRVSFSDLTEKLWFGGLDLSYSVTPDIQLSAGYTYSDTDRYSLFREFSPFITGDFLSDDLVPYLGLKKPGDIINGATLAGFNVRLDETSQFPAFNAELTIHGAYAKAQVLPVSELTLDLGVRYESAKQTVDLDQSIFTTPITGATPTLNEEDYFLPAATLTWEAQDGLQFRISASKTIARPQFRELVEQLYYDPDGNRAYRGNPYLTDSKLTNLEARGEYYFGGGNRFNLAGFYKKIDNPIEAFITTSAGNLITSFANAPTAELYGAEVEFQYTKDLNDWGGWFDTKAFIFFANYTYTQSKIGVKSGDVTYVPPSGPVDAAQFFDDGDPLTGQSDHVANVQIGLEDSEKLQQFTILLNYASKRVTSRGFQRPDVLEDPGLTVDFVARTEVNVAKRPFELKFEVRNIFGRGNFEYQENENNRIDINSYDRGTSFSLGVSTEF
ncbi:MAG: TonB-dependent receptor [Sphingomonadales bacterium 32-64-17]|nr:MAG: TonB-dependent receptor [Sphingomonadales bacterium 32-64-17]